MAPTIAPTSIEIKPVSHPDLKVPKASLNNSELNGVPKKRKILIFSDFDGTIMYQDTGHVLFDNHGCGPEKRHILDEQIKNGDRSFKEVSEEMWGSLKVPFDDGFEVMKTALEIDPGFQEFHQFCLTHSIPFNVISAGLRPILRRVLDSFLGADESSHISILANDASINTPGTEWKPVWLHDDSELGHDKALSVAQAREQAALECDDGTVPLIMFIGDGVSDLPAARQADVLFARKGLRLEEYCVENLIPYLGFETFADIKVEIEKIMEEDECATKGRGMPARLNPRANIWRRISSTRNIPKIVAAAPRDEKMLLWPNTFSEVAVAPVAA